MSENPSGRGKKSKNVLGRGLKSLLLPSLEDQDLEKLKMRMNEKSLDFQEDSTTADSSFSSSLGNSSSSGFAKEKSLLIKTLGIEQLKPNLNQPRKNFDPKALEELAASIKEKGLLQPILVRSLKTNQKKPVTSHKGNLQEDFSSSLETFEIIAGERRWRAAQKAGLHEIPVIVKETSDQKSLELALVENLQRKNLNPLEEAKAYQNLLETYTLTQQQLANFLGKDRVSISNLLRTLKLPEPAQEALASGQLSLGQAKVLLYLKNTEQQLEALNKVLTEGLTVTQLTHLVEKMKRTEEKKKPEKNASPSFSALEEMSLSALDKLSQDLQTGFGSRVRIHYSSGRGKVSFYFNSNEELSHLIDSFLET